MNKISVAFLCAIAFFPNLLMAQNCPQGIPSAGNPFCLPPNHPDSSYDQGGARNSPIWADRWGAIAFDPASGIYGTSSAMLSKRNAENDAIDYCRKSGGESCRVHLSYHNQCGVIAWGETYATTASAGTIAEASERAIRNCAVETAGCEIVYSNCSVAERIR